MIYGERGGRLHMFDVAQAEAYHDEIVAALELAKDSVLPRCFKRPHSKSTREWILSESQAFINMRNLRSMLHLKAMKGYSKNPDPMKAAEDLLTLVCKGHMFRENRWIKEWHTIWRSFNIQTFREDFENEFITGLSVQKGLPCPGSLTSECCADYVYVGTRYSVRMYMLPTGLQQDCKNISCFPNSFREAARAFLCCTRPGRRSDAAQLPDLPQDILRTIVSKLATPVSRWGETDMVARRELYEQKYDYDDVRDLYPEFSA
jgi:hypothetical protein